MVGFGSQKRLNLLFFNLWLVLRALQGREGFHAVRPSDSTSCALGICQCVWKRQAPLAVRVSVMAVPGQGASTTTVGDKFEAPAHTKPVPLHCFFRASACLRCISFHVRASVALSRNLVRFNTTHSIRRVFFCVASAVMGRDEVFCIWTALVWHNKLRTKPSRNLRHAFLLGKLKPLQRESLVIRRGAVVRRATDAKSVQEQFVNLCTWKGWARLTEN